jgi:hypothetical protein
LNDSARRDKKLHTAGGDLLQVKRGSIVVLCRKLCCICYADVSAVFLFNGEFATMKISG